MQGWNPHSKFALKMATNSITDRPIGRPMVTMDSLLIGTEQRSRSIYATVPSQGTDKIPVD